MKKVYRLGVFLAILSLLLVGCLGGGSKNYAISGVVTDENGTGIAGVKLALEGKKTSLIVETTEDGSWGASGLQGSVKVTPSKEGWVFEPSSKEVSKESKNVDFRGSDLDQEYSISGLVADALGIGIADVKIDLKGDDFSLVVHTTEDGSWSAKDLKGQITVEPQKEGWFFNPGNQEVAIANDAVNFTGVKGERLSVYLEGEGKVLQEIVMAVMDADYYPRTTEIQLTAEPDFDWFLEKWEGDVPEGLEKENPIIITLDESKEITAIFKQKTRVNGFISLAHSFPVCAEQMPDEEDNVSFLGGIKTREPLVAGLGSMEETYAENERIIRFDSSLSRSEQEANLRRAGFEILDTIEILNAHLVRSATIEGAKIAIELDGVLSSEPNYDVHLTELKIPNDRFYGSHQWWHYDQIRLPQAWAVTTGDSNVRVAVVDTGISTEHPDLAANVNLDLGANFVIGEDVEDIEDGHGHGSHVSGTIGAVTNNETGMAGIMWDVEIIPIKVFDASGRGSNWAVVNGMLYAAGLLDDQEDKPSIGRPADIVNMSLGGPGTEFQENAVELAVANNVILVAATGNDGDNLISYPAQYAGVIAVGATGYGGTQEPELAYYSNTGAAIDVVAPGGGVIQGSPYGYVWSTGDNGSYYGSAGTSMATPHVTGVIGLMLANGIPKDEIREVLRRTSMEIGAWGFNSEFGYGLVNAYWAVNAVEEMRIIQGHREGNEITAVAEITIPAKGDEQFRFELVQGEYQLIAWIDVNGNGVVDTSDYYTETPVIEFGYGEGWSWNGTASEVGEMVSVPVSLAEEDASLEISSY